MPRLIPPELGNGWRPGDPRRKAGTVATLDVSDDTHDAVGTAHDAALDPTDETTLLTALVYFDNPHPRDPLPVIPPGTPMWTRVNVGCSTLFGAATEVIACVVDQVLDMPAWVASTSPELADILAEHFTVEGYHHCTVMPMEEVVS